jgi:hypothetical protein
MTNYGRGRAGTPKVHFGASPTDTMCGRSPASRAYCTSNKAVVTCKDCLNRMAKEVSKALAHDLGWR